FGTDRIKPSARILIDPDGVRVRFHRYDGLPITPVVRALLERLPACDRPTPDLGATIATCDSPRREAAATSCSGSLPLKNAEVIMGLNVIDTAMYSFTADVGDGWFIGLELRTDVFLAPGYYGTMGFAGPAALGAGLAEPSRRPFALVGDGAFQMTGNELATM